LRTSLPICGEDLAMRKLAQMLCMHRVVVQDRGRINCQICGATLTPTKAATGHHALLRD
jgi:hypothetical protein